METYTSGFVSSREAVSLRQLQWWDEQKIVPVRHVGHTREYTAADILRIRVVRDLRKKGIGCASIRPTLRRVEKLCGFDIGGKAYLFVGGEDLRHGMGVVGLALDPEALAREAAKFTGKVAVIEIDPRIEKPKTK